MNRFALLAGAALALAPAPAAALDRTSPANKDEPRLRVTRHDTDEVVQMFLRVGQTGRILLGRGESVQEGGLLVSDQIALGDEEWTDDDVKAEQQAANRMNGGGSKGTTVCDRNLCRTIIGSAVFISPRRPLNKQPIFLRTKWCDPSGRYCEEGDYALEITTQPEEVKVADAAGRVPRPAEAFYSVRFTHEAREGRAQQFFRAEEARARTEAAKRCLSDDPPASCPQRPEPAPRVSVPDAATTWKFAECASNPDLVPNEAWSNGRTLFLRYYGSRPIPRFYQRRPGGDPELIQTAVEPEASHSTVVIAGVPKIVLIAEGKRGSCIVHVGNDRPGPGAQEPMAVAPQNPGRPRQ